MGDNRSRPRAEKTWPVRLKPEARKCHNWRERAGAEAEVDQSQRVTREPAGFQSMVWTQEEEPNTWKTS